MSFAGTVFDMINRNKQNLAARTYKRQFLKDKIRPTGTLMQEHKMSFSPKKYSKEELQAIQYRVAKKVKRNNLVFLIMCCCIMLVSLAATLLLIRN